MWWLLCDIVLGKVLIGDILILEDFSVLVKLSDDED